MRNLNDHSAVQVLVAVLGIVAVVLILTLSLGHFSRDVWLLAVIAVLLAFHFLV